MIHTIRWLLSSKGTSLLLSSMGNLLSQAYAWGMGDLKVAVVFYLNNQEAKLELKVYSSH